MNPDDERLVSLVALAASYPSLHEVVEALRGTISAVGTGLPLFEEPKVPLFLDTGEPARVEVDGDLLAAWICHMSHSTRVRMALAETAVLAALAKGNVLVPATLVRAHLEVAGWAALTNEELVKLADDGSLERLGRLIPKMLYGTALARERGANAMAVSAVPLVEAFSVMNAIDALDRFYRVVSGGDGGPMRLLYAALSDYAHPTTGGVRHLFDIMEDYGTGWRIQYRWKEQATEPQVAMLLTTLSQSARLGYSAALLMRLGTIDETGGRLVYIKPDNDDGRIIWEHVLRGQVPEDNNE